MTQTLSGIWNYPTEIHFAPGELRRLARHCREKHIGKPLLVTDSGLAGVDFFQCCQRQLARQGLSFAVFGDVQVNPTGANVGLGVDVLRRESCDGVVAIGGGSALDAGKAIALMAGQERDLFAFEDSGENWRKVDENGMLPCIAVPTTAGTGSEVGRAAVIVDEAIPVKKIIFHPNMMPARVIADPELTLQLPAALTAATGLDAFVHGFEAFCAPGFHPLADGIAVESMRLIRRWLEVAYREPSHLQARSQMLAASTMGATAFQKGLGAVHALAHPLGALYRAHHGMLNAILLPYVMRANRVAIEAKAGYLCRIFDLPEIGFEALLQDILTWRQRLGIANTLQQIGIDASRSEQVAKMAAADPSAVGNPLQFTQAQYADLFNAAVVGRL